MRRRKFQVLLVGGLVSGLAWSAGDEKPVTHTPAGKPRHVTSSAAQSARNLQVEMRQVEAAQGYAAGPSTGGSLLTPQQVLVRNGEQATLQLGQLVPLQWVSGAQQQSGSLSVGGGGSGNTSGSINANIRGGAVQQELQWMQTGQALRVRPRWTGGAAPVMLEVEIQAAALESHAGVAGAANLPAQTRGQWATTVNAPLGQWVTIARTGVAADAAQRGVYGSEQAVQTPRLLQLRVLAP